MDLCCSSAFVLPFSSLGDDRMKTIRVTAVDYEVEEHSGKEHPIVLLTGRDENGDRHSVNVLGTEPYFYMPQNDELSDESLKSVRYTEAGYESFDGVPVDKVVTRIPSDVEDIRETVSEDYESDIPFYRRVTIDYGLSGYIRVPENEVRVHIDDIETDIDVTDVESIDPRILIADIEVVRDSPGTFDQMMKDYDQPITHITVWDSKADDYVCLYLDPDDLVKGIDVKEYLEAETDSSRVSGELDREITLRSFQSESALLRGFVSIVQERQPDLFSGWNFVDFDWDYLLGRMAQFNGVNEHQLSDIGYVSGYQTERKVDCLPAFDMLGGYKKMTIPRGGQKRSYSLDYISKDEVDMGKIPNINVTESYEENRSRLTAYNIMDVMLCVAIDRKQSIHEFFFELAELSSVLIYDTFSEMRLIDGYIMSRSDDDEILPAASERDLPTNAGGLVLDPSDGVDDWVGVIDLKSLYPSCMITWNLSTETIHWYEDEEPDHEEYINIPWLPDADHADGGDFGLEDIDFDVMWADLSEQGIVPKYIKKLFPERAEMKRCRNEHSPDSESYELYDRRQAAIKVIMNAFYGVSSMDYWRLSTEGFGDAITSTARFSLWQGKEIASEEGHTISYGDTDSVMVSLGEEHEDRETVIQRGKKLEEIVNDGMVECIEYSGYTDEHPLLDGELHGTDRHTLVYEFEKLYRRFFQAGSKKRYAGNIVWKEGKDVDDMDLVGFESQRSDSPEITSQVQPSVIKRILDGEGFDGVSEYIRDIIEGIETASIDRYRVALPKSLGQPLAEYGNTQTAKACRYSNQYLDAEWDVEDDPWLYFIDSTPAGCPKTDAIALSWDEEIPEGYDLNLDKTVERGIERPLRPVLEEVGWKFEELEQGAQTQSAAETSDWGEYETESNDEESDEGGEWSW